MRTLCRSTRGMAMGIIVLILLVVAVLIVAIGLKNTQTLADAALLARQAQAQSTAQAGVQASLATLESELPSWWDASGQYRFGGPMIEHPQWRYDVTLTDNRDGAHPAAADGSVIPSGAIHVASRGSVDGSVTARVNAVLQPLTMFHHALYVTNYLDVQDNAAIIHGSIGTNRVSSDPPPVPITLHNLSNVIGQIILPSVVSDPLPLLAVGHASSTDLLAQVAPQTVPLPTPAMVAPTLPTYDLPTRFKNKQASLPPDHRFPNAVDLQGTDMTLGPGIYVFSANVTLDGNSRLLTSGADAAHPVIIYVESAWDSGGGTIVNASDDPRALQMYGTNSCTSIAFSGGADAAMAIYAPNATMTLQGNGSLVGSFVGKVLEVTGGASVTFDARVTNISPPGLEHLWQVATWQRR